MKGKLSYVALAMEDEQTAYRSLLIRLGAVLADPKPLLARLVRGCIAMAFTASVPAVGLHAATALLMPSRTASSGTWHWRWKTSKPRTDRY